MQRIYRRACWILLIAAVSLSSCSTLKSETPAPLIPGLAQTLAAQTLTALDIRDGLASTPEAPGAASAPEQVLVFENLMTGTPAPAETRLAVEANPEETQDPEATPQCTNLAEFVRDVTVPDNTNFDPKERFVKTWEFKNAGTCTWNAEYSIVFMWGESMSCPSRVPVGEIVEPGDTVTISVPLIAPEYPRDYQGNWLFEDHTGRRFGTGYKGRQFFWVAISVGGGGPGGGGEMCLGGG